MYQAVKTMNNIQILFRTFHKELFSIAQSIWTQIWRIAGLRITVRACVGILLLILTYQMLMVGFISYQHVPYFSHDEAFTLRLAHLNSQQIIDVIMHEQNSPLYYILIHYVLLMRNGSEQMVIMLNYIAWIISLFLVYKITR